MTSAAASSLSWRLRYASHLGYRSHDTPLYVATVGSLDATEHVDFAASLGLSGVQYALAVSRPAEERAKFATAMRRQVLETGCVIYAPPEITRAPLWNDAGARNRDEIRNRLRTAFAVANEVGSTHVAILSGADPDAPIAPQHAALIENLKQAADLAHGANVTICLEAVSNLRLKNMLLHYLSDTLEVLRKVDHPRVRLAFDTSHTQVMDGDVLAWWRESLPFADLLQRAEGPNRIEPGTGEIDFEAILEEAIRRNFRGLVELEHGWSEPSAATEKRSIEWLRSIDARAAERVASGGESR